MPQAVGCSAALTALMAACASQSNESLHLLLRVADEICADFDLLRSWPERDLSQLFVNLEPLLATIRSALFLGEVITPLAGARRRRQLRGRDQRGQLLPRVEHARPYCGLGDADYLGNLLDGFRSA
jgi:hypothetical protein